MRDSGREDAGVAEIRDVALAHIFEKGPLHEDILRPPQGAEPAVVLRRSGHAGHDLVRQIGVVVTTAVRSSVSSTAFPFAKGID